MEQKTSLDRQRSVNVFGAILIGLLVPALNLVRDYAKELQQAAQFHSIEVAVDMFVADSGYGNYPPSNDNSVVPMHSIDPTPYCGAHKLAEALVGWDLLGYHPNADFRADGSNDVDGDGTSELIYDPVNGFTSNTISQTGEENIRGRKGPYIELENANAFALGDIYNNNTLTSIGFLEGNYVLCDVYAKNRSVSGKKIGMPILYFRARTEFYDQNYTVLSPNAPATLTDPIEDDIYYYRDNYTILTLGTPDGNGTHILLGDDSQADWRRFEEKILNTEVTTMNRPYRAGSFILISAGKDGLYGTADDQMNINKDL